MTAQPLDPYTLRQAAGRWPRETLNTRAAQGFLIELAQDAEWQREHPPEPGTASVILFRKGGKYYTEERWRIPPAAISPHDMARSLDFRRIDGGPVLVDTQEPWGYPYLLQPATLNPLRTGLQELLDTFPDTWISRAALQSLLDEHQPQQDACRCSVTLAGSQGPHAAWCPAGKP